MVIKINRKREGTTDRASNQITAQLGNTINGPQSINGVSPGEMKKDMDVMSDMLSQSNVTNGPAETAGMEQASGSSNILNPQGQLGQALQGQNGEVDLSKVPQDQKDFLLQNMMMLNGAKQQEAVEGPKTLSFDMTVGKFIRKAVLNQMQSLKAQVLRYDPYASFEIVEEKYGIQSKVSIFIRSEDPDIIIATRNFLKKWLDSVGAES